MSKKSLVKSTGVIGSATAISRILGFVRDIIIANLFGTGIAAQAFVVAFRIPNSLRDLVGEGAMNAAIVPVLTETRTHKGEAAFIHVARVLFNITCIALFALTVIGMIASPLIVRIIAPGFLHDPAKFALTVTMNRIIFPYLVLIGLTAYAMGVLNTVKHFAAPAFGPALLNIALIVAALVLCPQMGVMGLAIGVLVGGGLQLAINVPALYRRGISMRFSDGIRDSAVRKMGTLLVPRAIGSAVYQINIFVDTIIASIDWIVGAGGVAALYYANRLIQLPLAVFGIALAQAALPKMSQEVATGDMERFKETIAFSLRIVILVMLPSTIGLAVIGQPIIKILFERGEFTAYSTAITTNALFFYAFGLAAYSGVKILVTAFYSMHDTRTPVKTAFRAVVLNIILSLIFIWPLKLGGLALATSISATFNFFSLATILMRSIGDFGVRRIIDSGIRVLGASIVMGVVLALLVWHGYVTHLAALLVTIGVGIIVFVGACILVQVHEIGEFRQWITAKR